MAFCCSWPAPQRNSTRQVHVGVRTSAYLGGPRDLWVDARWTPWRHLANNQVGGCPISVLRPHHWVDCLHSPRIARHSLVAASRMVPLCRANGVDNHFPNAAPHQPAAVPQHLRPHPPSRRCPHSLPSACTRCHCDRRHVPRHCQGQALLDHPLRAINTILQALRLRGRLLAFVR